MAIDSVSLDGRLRSAIRDRRLVSLSYQGKSRLAEPHDYGVQKGLERLLVYQLSSTPRVTGRSAAGWRLLEVSKIEECTVLERQFSGSRAHAHRSHYVWDVVYARVQ